jgi:hypothetical protein
MALLDAILEKLGGGMSSSSSAAEKGGEGDAAGGGGGGDGVSGSVRETCAMCLNEFLAWSIKSTTDRKVRERSAFLKIYIY